MHKRASTNAHIYPSVLQALPGRGYTGCLEGVIPGVLRGLIQDSASELPRICIPRTSVNKGKRKEGRDLDAPAPKRSLPSPLTPLRGRVRMAASFVVAGQ